MCRWGCRLSIAHLGKLPPELRPHPLGKKKEEVLWADIVAALSFQWSTSQSLSRVTVAIPQVATGKIAILSGS